MYASRICFEIIQPQMMCFKTNGGRGFVGGRGEAYSPTRHTEDAGSIPNSLSGDSSRDISGILLQAEKNNTRALTIDCDSFLLRNTRIVISLHKQRKYRNYRL